ncbi:Protein BIM1 [Spathaspora sp. JA1]|nr:Protein BIM1 [Spathaspora sp. JA1]
MVVGESRNELLQWLNTTLDLNYTKVEQCGTGAAFCQLLDSIVGGIPVSKLRFNGTSEYDYRHNWKILQSGFTRNKITKNIDVEKLIKCRLQDNLELLQWFRRYWLENKDYNDVSYDASAKRRVSSGGANNSSSSGTITGSNTSRRTSTKQFISSPHIPPPTTQRRVSSASSIGSSSHSAAADKPTRAVTPTSTIPSANGAALRSKINQLNGELEESLQEINQLRNEIQDNRISTESLQTERNFYYNKLQDIEMIVQHILDAKEHGQSYEFAELDIFKLSHQIQTILYATEEGFGEATADTQVPTPMDTRLSSPNPRSNDVFTDVGKDYNITTSAYSPENNAFTHHVLHRSVDMSDNESF